MWMTPDWSPTTISCWLGWRHTQVTAALAWKIRWGGRLVVARCCRGGGTWWGVVKAVMAMLLRARGATWQERFLILRSHILAVQSSPPVYIHRPSAWGSLLPHRLININDQLLIVAHLETHSHHVFTDPLEVDHRVEVPGGQVEHPDVLVTCRCRCGCRFMCRCRWPRVPAAASIVPSGATVKEFT